MFTHLWIAGINAASKTAAINTIRKYVLFKEPPNRINTIRRYVLFRSS